MSVVYETRDDNPLRLVSSPCTWVTSWDDDGGYGREAKWAVLKTDSGDCALSFYGEENHLGGSHFAPGGIYKVTIEAV